MCLGRLECVQTLAHITRVAEFGLLKLSGHTITKMDLEKVFELFFTFPDTCLRRTTQIEKTGHFPNLGQNGRFLHFSLRISAVILLVLRQNFRDLENAL